MMSINFTCPCSHELKVKEELAGKKVKCPKCGGIRVVPSAEEEPSPPPPEEESEDSRDEPVKKKKKKSKAKKGRSEFLDAPPPRNMRNLGGIIALLALVLVNALWGASFVIERFSLAFDTRTYSAIYFMIPSALVCGVLVGGMTYIATDNNMLGAVFGMANGIILGAALGCLLSPKPRVVQKAGAEAPIIHAWVGFSPARSGPSYNGLAPFPGEGPA